ncbi:CDP-diacylglycerol--glycerol-3-phosphate 3-phosphatidyltransferase 2 isoform X1 [Sesamum indicum]|uniref:CDP-diacylglycerol--glycerol-3-phosphate 1-phosphatidyltransferase n=1 Tax=Sesamum indicum TaxID=4182 RepID=A0A6I9T8W8_SESIN|nr:CDP-diacylglycerol--glycerol-3-phosphate 3-phosphatidyltransferase 2 isoform X1 [Sesamum indicum]
MPAALKFTNLTILHPHKPYNFLNNFSSSTASTAGSARILRLKYSAGWSGRTTPYAPAAHRRITSQILGGRKPHHFSSESGNRREGIQCFCNSKTNSDTKMCATVNRKVDNQSNVSPPPDYHEKSPLHPPKLLTLPTILTIGRVAAVPLLVGTFYVHSWWGPVATTSIFISAAFTDWLDGYLARKMNLGTPFGAFLDPVADKLMVAATLILLSTRPLEAGMFLQTPWLLAVPAIAIIGREITMSAVREWAASQDRKLLEAVAVNNLGKWKTATQMLALTILLAARDGSLVVAGTLAYSGVLLLYISAWLALWSLVVYVRKIWKVLLR